MKKCRQLRDRKESDKDNIEEMIASILLYLLKNK